MPIPILRKLRAIRRRLLWIAFLRVLLQSLAAAFALLALFVLAGRLTPLPVGLERIAPWVGGAAGLWLLICLGRRRMQLAEAATHADQTLGLKERLSTAWLIGEPRSEAEMAVLEDAAAHAARIRPRQDFHLDLHRELRWSFWLIACFVALWLFMPQMNLRASQQNQRQALEIAIQTSKEAAKELEQLADGVDEKTDLHPPEAGQQFRREMAALAKKLADQKLTPEQAMAQTQVIKDKLNSRRAELEKQLKMPNNLLAKGEGRQTGEISRQLEKGNFSQAAKALDELKRKLQKGELSAQDKAALQKEMKMLADKLGKDSPLAQALNKACDKMAAGKTNAALADIEDAGGQMREMDGALKELAALDSVDVDLKNWGKCLCQKPGLCKDCACQGDSNSDCAGHRPWAAGDSRHRGNGMGRAGIGQGQVANKKEGPIQLQKSRIKGDIAPGKIIARMKVAGGQSAGKIDTQYESLRLEYSQQAEDSLQNEALPLEYKTLVRDYYDAIKK